MPFTPTDYLPMILQIVACKPISIRNGRNVKSVRSRVY